MRPRHPYVLFTLLCLACLSSACSSSPAWDFDLGYDNGGVENDFKNVYVLTRLAQLPADPLETYFAFDPGTAAAGHRTFDVIYLYDEDSATFTEVGVQGNGPRGWGDYTIRVVDQLTPHVNSRYALDVAGF
jgi:hypothetical protein